MKNTFKLSATIVAVGVLVLGAVAATNLNILAQAQKTFSGNKTTGGEAVAGNATGNMTKGNSTSVPTPVGPPGP